MLLQCASTPFRRCKVTFNEEGQLQTTTRWDMDPKPTKARRAGWAGAVLRTAPTLRVGPEPGIIKTSSRTLALVCAPWTAGIDAWAAAGIPWLGGWCEAPHQSGGGGEAEAADKLKVLPRKLKGLLVSRKEGELEMLMLP